MAIRVMRSASNQAKLDPSVRNAQFADLGFMSLWVSREATIGIRAQTHFSFHRPNQTILINIHPWENLDMFVSP